ncbi:hypothetical protein F5Y12DRAFT_798577 [Xylaria sp. FL1777]|nr:hypothetical protein F5Y12DRAFT_798577 [Xylaria sp. FL1777]
MVVQTENQGVIVRDLGFTTLAKPDWAAVDIILIHGLQGHPKNTWLYSPPREKPSFKLLKMKKPRPRETEPQETFWPLDILPGDFSDARIMTYGYDSHITHWFKGPAMQLDIDQYGEGLLNAMEACRRDDPHRPLIFIVHSLGGLILKDALRRARSSSEERFKHVYNSIKGLLFFGTPHRGGSYVELGLTVRRIAALAGFNANDKVLRSLSFDGTHARILREEFALVLKDLNPRLFIFQEGLGVSGFGPLSGKVVEDFSSALDVGEQKETIVANHINMCRFNGEDDDGYVKVKGALELAISEISSIPREDNNLEKLNLIYPVDPSHFKNDITGEDNQLLEGTGSWIFKGTTTTTGKDSSRKQSGSAAETFAKWVNSDLPRVLWIKGDPGKGKTMLALSIVDDLLRRNQFNVAHFFCKNSEDGRNTAANIMECILRQLYSWQPELLYHFDACAKELSTTTKHDWKFSTLWELLENTIRDSKFRASYFVIDGLDECDDASASLFLKRLRRTNFGLGKEPNHSTKVQWLITSRDEDVINREFREFHAEHALIISLKDNSGEVQKSVERYIVDRVRKLAVQEGYDEELQKRVKNYLREHADGTFLWVAIVCEELKGEPADVAEQALCRFPSGLTSLYKRILGQVLNNKDRSKALLAKQILQTTVVAFRPLTLQELAVAADLPKEIRNKDEGIRYYIRLCRSFLRIQLGHVIINHQSVKDYLVPMRCEDSCPREHDFKVLYHPDPARCRCVHHLLSPDDYPSVDRVSVVLPIDKAEGHGVIVSRSIDSMTEILRKDIYNLQQPSYSIEDVEIPDPDPLAPIRYACAYWTNHLSAIEGCYDGVGFSNIGKINRFLEKKAVYWLEAMSLMKNIPEAVAMLMDLESAIVVSNLILKRSFNCNLISIKHDKQHDEQRNSLSSIVYDAKRFTLAFRSIIEVYPLQIYNSALLFSPSKSTIRKQFSKEIPTWVQNQRPSTLEENWTPYLHTLECHDERVLSVAFSPDGSLLASREGHHTIRLWNPITGAALRTIESHMTENPDLEFSPNGVYLASCGSNKDKDCTIELWDPTSGKKIHELEGNVRGLAKLTFSADSNQIAAVLKQSDRYLPRWYTVAVGVWDTAKSTGRNILECDNPYVGITCLAFSPDGSQLAAGWEAFRGRPSLCLWELSTGKRLHLMNCHMKAVNALSFSPNGKQLASGSEDGTIQLREPTRGTLLCTLISNSPILAFDFSSDSSRLTSVSMSQIIQIWDITTGDVLQTHFRLSHEDEKLLKFSPDGSMLVCASNIILRVYDTVTGLILHILEVHDRFISALAFSPNGSQLASVCGGDGTVRLWDLTTKALSFRSQDALKQVHEVIFSSDGNRLAFISIDGTIQLWDPVTGATIAAGFGHCTGTIAFSPNNEELVSGSFDGSVCIWDPITGAALKTLNDHGNFEKNIFSRLVLSPDVRHLAIGPHLLGTIWLWDYTSGARMHILQVPVTLIIELVFSPDSSWLACGSTENIILLWNTATGALLHKLDGRYLAFSPNSHQLASSSGWSTDEGIMIWDIVNKELLYTLDGGPMRLIFSSDGNRLLSGRPRENEPRSELWDLTTRVVVDTLDCHPGLTVAAASWGSQDKLQPLYVVDSSGCWITRNDQKVILLPHDNRPGVLAIGRRKLAIAGHSGRVTILEFQ